MSHIMKSQKFGIEIPNNINCTLEIDHERDRISAESN
jgi:hypothetical protein